LAASDPLARTRPGANLPAAAWIALALGVWASVVALATRAAVKVALSVPVLLIALSAWVIFRPSRWLGLFFFFLLLAPPLPLPFGNTGIHIAPLFAIFGILGALVWKRDWRPVSHPLTWALALFSGILLESVAFAALYSGWEIAAGSLARVALFAISVFVFLYSYAGPLGDPWRRLRIARILFGLGVAGALFACADFYFQFPAPAGYGDQFVWLEQGVFRRAQGLFYEASTLGNCCAFFLVMVMVSLVRRRDETPIPRPALLLGAPVLAAALMFSYSRASVVNVAVAAAVLTSLHFGRLRRALILLAMTLAVAGVAVHWALPALSANYWGRLLGSFTFFQQAPDQVLSGRLTHWQTLLDFIAREPWHLVFGVGYKTLPYSSFIGSTVIADNTYLGLLVETGVIGLAAFLWLHTAILRAGWNAMRSAPTSFFGEWIFCFWCGELVQMFSGDLITYWRVLPVYFWVLGAAARKELEDT
jgi:O-antigen ligase